ncbi:MAG: Crp/Fnr family transcriptional regulator [Synergistaceae bacterium]|nr:Crp/Fnr family transcriptional regulator [Synergistaceae bacterium]
MKIDFDVLKKCSLFKNIPDEFYNKILKYLRAVKKTFRRGEFVVNIGDEFRHAGLILEGVIECSFEDLDFNKLNMNHFTAGETFGATMAFAGIKDSPMKIVAISKCTILFLDLQILNENQNFEFKTQLSANLLQSFARQNLFLNQKVRILSQKDLRGKILVYLRTLQSDENGARTIPFSKTAWAEFLCVNRTALSRELSKMVQDKTLSMNGRTFILY